jgi:hypothetical protein
VVLAGPFTTPRGIPEYLVAPLYTGQEPGFVWTSEDVRLSADDTGLGAERFVGIWNARPVLEADLAFELGRLSDEATVAVRDAYWASLNERRLGPSPRLGREVRSASDPAARYQAAELDRWEPLSGRVFAHPAEVSGSTTFLCGDVWTLTPADVDGLSRAIEESETLVGPVTLDGSGPAKVWLSFSLTVGSLAAPDARRQPDLFEPPRDRSAPVERSEGARVLIAWSHDPEQGSPATLEPELARAA